MYIYREKVHLSQGIKLQPPLTVSLNLLVSCVTVLSCIVHNWGSGEAMSKMTPILGCRWKTLLQAS